LTNKISQSKTGKQQAQNITLALKKWYTIKNSKEICFSARSKYWTKSTETLKFIEEEKKKEEKKETSARGEKKKKRRKELHWHLGTPDLKRIEEDFSGCIFGLMKPII